MKWARFALAENSYAGYLENGTLFVVEGDIFAGEWQETGETFPLDDVTLLAPCLPTKVIGIGLNYRDHAEEMNMALPSEPLVFFKAPSAVIGPGEAILYPDWIGRMDYEAELAVVIGRRAKNVPAAEADAYIFGYTCGNDVTARRLQKKDGQWARAKSFDTFCPLGPWVVAGLDAAKLNVFLELNGEIKQKSNTSQLMFGPRELVASLSRFMTLEPGDVILTGTPSGVGPMTTGDRVTVRIEAIGDLTNNIEQAASCD